VDKNVIEADHGKLKQLIKPVRGFKTMRTAYATIKGFEVMRTLRKGQGRVFNLTSDPIPLSQDSCRLVFKLYDGLRMAENGYERGLFKRA
jgi:hypothetical protein